MPTGITVDYDEGSSLYYGSGVDVGAGGHACTPSESSPVEVVRIWQDGSGIVLVGVLIIMVIFLHGLLVICIMTMEVGVGGGGIPVYADNTTLDAIKTYGDGSMRQKME